MSPCMLNLLATAAPCSCIQPHRTPSGRPVTRMPACAPVQLPRTEILPPRVARWEAYEDRNRLIRCAQQQVADSQMPVV